MNEGGPTVKPGATYLLAACAEKKDADYGVQQFEIGSVMQKRVFGRFAEPSSNSSSNSIGPAG